MSAVLLSAVGMGVLVVIHVYCGKGFDGRRGRGLDLEK